MAQRLKCLPAMWETWVQSLGQEDPLEKEMATHSSILVWKIPWTEELGGLESTGRKESDTTERLHFHFPGIAFPQSGLLSQVSSLRLPLGHSGPVLTLSNAAHASLPSPHLLVVDSGICAASLLGVTLGHIICGV